MSPFSGKNTFGDNYKIKIFYCLSKTHFLLFIHLLPHSKNFSFLTRTGTYPFFSLIRLLELKNMFQAQQLLSFLCQNHWLKDRQLKYNMTIEFIVHRYKPHKKMLIFLEHDTNRSITWFEFKMSILLLHVSFHFSSGPIKVLWHFKDAIYEYIQAK